MGHCPNSNRSHVLIASIETAGGIGDGIVVETAGEIVDETETETLTDEIRETLEITEITEIHETRMVEEMIVDLTSGVIAEGETDAQTSDKSVAETLLRSLGIYH